MTANGASSGGQGTAHASADRSLDVIIDNPNGYDVRLCAIRDDHWYAGTGNGCATPPFPGDARAGTSGPEAEASRCTQSQSVSRHIDICGPSWIPDPDGELDLAVTALLQWIDHHPRAEAAESENRRQSRTLKGSPRRRRSTT